MCSSDLHAGLAEVQLQGKHGVVDIKNQRVLPFNYVDIGGTIGPLFPVKKKTQWGFVDRAGDRNMGRAVGGPGEGPRLRCPRR